MQIVDGKLVLGMGRCWNCHGGKITPHVKCKFDGKAQRGKPCMACGGTSKSHNWLKQPERDCERCKGTATVPETRYDSLPKEEWVKLPFRVIRQDRRQSQLEQVLGLGVYSCVDYGQAYHENDDEKLIADVKGSGSHQACKIANEDGIVCQYVGIFVAVNGYSVIPVFSE